MNKRLLTKLSGLILVLTLAFGLPGLVAKQADLAPVHVDALIPANKHANLDKTIATLLTRYHYRQDQLDDDLSTLILDAYLEALDFNRSYFLAEDIAIFKHYRLTLDDDLLTGNLSPAFEIFNVYQQRLAERTERIQEQLTQKISFGIDESLKLDRRDAPWAISRTELDELWRKRLKNELLTLMLAGKVQTVAKETVEKRYTGRLRRPTHS